MDTLIKGMFSPCIMVHYFRYEDRLVAIKVLVPKRTKDATPECKAKFQREVNLLSRIQHSNVIKVFFKCMYAYIYLLPLKIF